MHEDQHHGGGMTREEAAEMIARRLDEHDQRISRLTAQFAALQRTRNALQDLRDEVHQAAEQGGLAMAINAIAATDRATSERDRAIAATAHEAATTALNRIPRHGGATVAGIGIRHEDGWLTVAVGDNGPDGDASVTDKEFDRLEARVNAFDGHVLRVSTPGEGTTVVIGLPDRHAG